MPKISIKRWVKRNPAVLVGTSLIIVFVIGLLLYRLTSLHPSPNSYESEALERLSSPSTLVNNPINFVYFAISWVLSLIVSDLTALRLTSVIFALLTLLNVRNIIKYWYDSRTANIGALLLTTSFWFITLGRIGSPLIMPAFWLSLILSLGSWQRYTTKQKTVKLFIGITTVLGIYSPVFIWWMVALAIILITQYGFKNILKRLRTPQIILPVLLLLPLIIASRNLEVLKEVVGMNSFVISPFSFIKNVFEYVSQLIVRGTFNPAINLGRLPYLDIFQTLMLGLGLFVLVSHRKNLRGLVLLFTPLILLGIISISTLNQTNLAVILPIVFVVITAGVHEFITLWLKGFPRNPIGRAAGLLLCVILISASGYYNAHRYFVAWAKNPDVKSAHKQL